MTVSKKTAQFSISEENYWRLKEVASREKKTLSVFLRDAVQHYLDGQSVDINLSEDLESWGGNRRGETQADETEK